MSSRFPTLACVLAAVATLAGCTTSAAPPADDALRTVRIYDLLRAFPRATMQVYKTAYVANDKFAVNDEVRPGLFLHASGTVVFPAVRVAPESVLTFKIGLVDDAWDKGSDGAEFMVFVKQMNNAATQIFSRFVDPVHNLSDRRWISETVSLRRFGNEEIRIMLATGPGPANDYNADWAVFAEPQIVLGPGN